MESSNNPIGLRGAPGEQPPEKAQLVVDMRTSLVAVQREFRFALRRIAKSPGNAAAIVVTLALGVGVVVSLLRLTNEVLLRPRPVSEPNRVISLWTRSPGDSPGSGFGTFSYPDYVGVRDRTRSFGAIAAQSATGAAYLTELTDDAQRMGASGRLSFTFVTSGYFTTLGVAPTLGREFARAEELGTRPVAVISDSLWRRHLHMDPEILGRVVNINGSSFEVVGVAPPGFDGPLVGLPVDVWVPVGAYRHILPADGALMPPDLLTARGSPWLYPIARLASGVTLNVAQQELSSLSLDVLEDHPTLRNGSELIAISQIRAHPLMVNRWLEWAQYAAVLALVVLFLTCVNIANVFLSVVIRRDKEVAIRRALGEQRRRVVLGVLIEAGLLAGLAGLLAIGLSSQPARVLATFLPGQSGFAAALDLSLDARVVALGIAISLMGGMLFAFGPALWISRSDSMRAYHESGTQGPRRRRLRTSLLVVQIAISMLLTVSASLLVRSFWQLRFKDAGFDTRTVVVVELEAQLVRDHGARGDLLNGLLSDTGAMPEVDSSSLGMAPPGGIAFQLPVSRVGDRLSSEPTSLHALANLIGPGFFDTAGMEMVLGRDFTSLEVRTSSPLAIISETMATRLWPSENPIGQHLQVSPPYFVTENQEPRIAEVIGVVKDTPVASRWEIPGSRVYLPISWFPTATAHWPTILLTRTKGAGEDIREAIRQAIRVSAPEIPINSVQTASEVVSSWLHNERAAAVLTAVIASLALALAIVGTYGVVSFGLAQRRREFGIRLAVGSLNSDLTKLILASVGKTALAGILIGIGPAAIAARWIASRFHGVDSLDPISYGAGALVLLISCFFAACVPMRRILRSDLSQTLWDS